MSSSGQNVKGFSGSIKAVTGVSIFHVNKHACGLISVACIVTGYTPCFTKSDTTFVS